MTTTQNCIPASLGLAGSRSGSIVSHPRVSPLLLPQDPHPLCLLTTCCCHCGPATSTHTHTHTGSSPGHVSQPLAKLHPCPFPSLCLLCLNCCPDVPGLCTVGNSPWALHPQASTITPLHLCPSMVLLFPEKGSFPRSALPWVYAFYNHPRRW